MISPLYLYAVHTFKVSKPERTSPFIIINLVTPLTWQAYFNATKSSQPQRLGRPVTAPNSFPTLAIFKPTSSNNSVGNGPEPTRVVYALKIPYTSPIWLGATPKPVQAPAAVVLLDVTNGLVPKSICNKEPCAPSAKMLFPSFWTW